MNSMMRHLPEAGFPVPDEVTVIALVDDGYEVPLAHLFTDRFRLVRTIDISRIDPADCDLLESKIIWFGLTEEPGAQWREWISQRAGVRSSSACIVDAVGENAVEWSWAELGATRVSILADAEHIERRIAVESALTDFTPAAFDSGNDPHSHELDRLRDEVGRIARALSNLTRAEADRLTGGGCDAETKPTHPAGWPFADDGTGVSDEKRGYGHQPMLAPLQSEGRASGVTSLDIRKMIRMRRLRDKHFPGEIFSDPAWDMLLDLMAARIDRRPVSVSSLCIASAVPATTALRWIKTMTEAGLFERRSDPHDGRRVFIALSDDSTQAMHAYFADMLAVGSLLPA